MSNEIIIKTGYCFLYFLSGCSFVNCMMHLYMSFSIDKLPKRFKNSYMATRTGNAIAAIISLFVGLIIPALLDYQFGLNLFTLFLFLGIGFVSFLFAFRADKREKKD